MQLVTVTSVQCGVSGASVSTNINIMPGPGLSCILHTRTAPGRGPPANQVVTRGVIVPCCAVSTHCRSYKEIANLSYEDFLDHVTELNEISSQFLDSNGKLLVFAVKKGTDSTPLWKGTVRVACCKVDAATQEVDSYRLLTLKQFLAIFKSLQVRLIDKTLFDCYRTSFQTQTAALREEETSSSPDSSEPASPSEEAKAKAKKPHPLTVAKFSASLLLDEALGAEELTSLDEVRVL